MNYSRADDAECLQHCSIFLFSEGTSEPRCHLHHQNQRRCCADEVEARRDSGWRAAEESRLNSFSSWSNSASSAAVKESSSWSSYSSASCSAAVESFRCPGRSISLINLCFSWARSRSSRRRLFRGDAGANEGG
jgi:hypothetical protein